MTLKTVAQIGLWSLAGFLLVPAGIALRWVVCNVYCAWRTWKQDRIELEALRTLAQVRAQREQIVRLQPDERGFNGVVYDQRHSVFSDLDTGASWTPITLSAPHGERLTGNVKQRMLAALSGSTFLQRVVGDIIGEERPPLQLAGDDGWLQIEVKTPDEGEIEV
jgi:hypothetical protein